MITNQELTEMLYEKVQNERRKDYEIYKEKIPEIDFILEKPINELKKEVLNGNINHKVCIDHLRNHKLFEYIKRRAKQLGYKTYFIFQHNDKGQEYASFNITFNQDNMYWPLLDKSNSYMSESNELIMDYIPDNDSKNVK